MTMESKTTSKTSSIKALLLRAWRERWTDLQWGINIKTVLPRGVSGDVYNLADCILQQATAGAGANQLVLSYLRHSLSTQLVSHAAVLQRLSKYNQFSKVYCVMNLLEFLEGMLPGVTCFGKPEETLLVTAILSTALWLLNILHHCPEASALNQKTKELLKILLTDDFYVSMICLARYNDPELFQETSHKCTELLPTLQDSDEITAFIVKLENIDTHMLCLSVENEKWPGSLIQYWLEIYLTKNPGGDTLGMVGHLRVFQKLKGYSDVRLIAELIRVSLLGLYNVYFTQQEHEWGAFAYLRLPQILQVITGKSDGTSIVNAIELILQHTPLLDAMDASCSSPILKCFLDELSKNRLINESQAKHLLEKRKTPTVVKLNENTNSIIPMSAQQICAETTLAGVLKTLTSDYNKTKDVMVGLIHQVLACKSFRLILSVASSSGKLQTLVDGLVRLNDSFALGHDKLSLQLFDMSFVMLVSILQSYGSSVVLKPDEDSLVRKWLGTCLMDRHRPKSPAQLLRRSDSAIVESLTQQFNSGDSDLKPNMTLKDVLFNLPGVMYEVLIAWEQGVLMAVDVKRILDTVREQMCCMPIAAANYLIAYMKTTFDETLLKPINMVQQLLVSPTLDDETLKDRWMLTCEIVRKTQRHILLPTIKSNRQLMSRFPATEWLHGAWNSGITQGWFDHSSVERIPCLLETAGPRWIVNAVIKELLKLKYRDHLQRGVDIALAIFNVDITACTTELLSHILPQLLFADVESATLVEPQLSAVAYLTSYCIYTALDSVVKSYNPEQTQLSDEDVKPSTSDEIKPCSQLKNHSGNPDVFIEPSYEDLEHQEKDEEPPTKMPRFDNLDHDLPETPAKKLIHALLQLLSMFEKMKEGAVTPQTHFIFKLIKSLVEVKIKSAGVILSYLPPSLISDLLKTLPDLFSFPLLLHLHDVATPSGRINMAKDLCVLRNYHLRNVALNVAR